MTKIIRVFDVYCAQFSGEFYGGRSRGRVEGVSSRRDEGASAPRPGHHAYSDHMSASPQGATASSASTHGRRGVGQQNTRDGTCWRSAARVSVSAHNCISVNCGGFSEGKSAILETIQTKKSSKLPEFRLDPARGAYSAPRTPIWRRGGSLPLS